MRAASPSLAPEPEPEPEPEPGIEPELEFDPLALQVAVEVADTDAEGPGRRYAIWVQGCPMRCPGCCNPELLAFRGGTPTRADDLLARVLAAHERSPIEGISLLGGEPFSQAAALAHVAAGARAAGLSVMIYSGHTLAELQAQPDPAVARLLALCDLLVDGRYERELPDTTRRWIGSRNQVLHFLSDRYSPLDRRFHAGETIEIRLIDGELTINGWPWGKGLPK